jgi:hypothetical protein
MGFPGRWHLRLREIHELHPQGRTPCVAQRLVPQALAGGADRILTGGRALVGIS